MTTPASDFDAAVRALRTQTLPAVVAYTESGSAHGIAHFDQPQVRIVVDVRNGRVISRTPASGDSDMEDVGLLTKRVFDPACYVATSERAQQYDGRSAIAIGVSKTSACTADTAFSTIYADASNFELLGADSLETDEGMTIAISIRYGRVGGYIVPTSISAHAYGHGWLFWARERAELTYTDYAFGVGRREPQQP